MRNSTQIFNRKILIKPFLLTLMILSISLKSLIAQVTHTVISYSNPVVVNFTERAKYELAHPVLPVKRFIEQGEDRENFKIRPKPVIPNSKVSNFETQKSNNTPTVSSPSPILNYNGILDNSTVIPPDINGAVGPAFVMETTNQQFAIYNKSGVFQSNVTITTLFQPSGGRNYYDPHIIYDPNNQRFVISIDGTVANGDGGFFLAVSQTNNPTGNWYIYSIDALGNAVDLLDYDQVGFNKNWIVMTGNDFIHTGGNAAKIYVFNRANLYAGNAGTVTAFTDNTVDLLSPASTYDAAQTIEYLASDWNGNSGGKGYIRVSKITGAVGTPAYSTGSNVGVNQPWSQTEINARQLGNANLIESGDTRIHSCILRNGLLWITHTVFLPASAPTYSGVDWWQLDPTTLGVRQFDRIADAGGTNFYYYPSLDVNTTNDMLIGYSASSANAYVGAQYALHLSSDASSTIETPLQFVNGVAGYYKTYAGTRNRWGDYSGTFFNPSDNSFYTFQEWANNGNQWGTRIAQVPAVYISGPLYFCTSGIYTVTNLPTGATVNWTISPASGVATLTQSNNQATLTKFAVGSVTITANITYHPGVTGQLSLSVACGFAPVKDSSVATSSCSGTYQTWGEYAVPVSHATSWQWTKDYVPPGSDIFIYNPSSSSTFVDVSGGGTIKLTYTDVCGNVKIDGATIYSSCHSPGASSFNVTPNPAANAVTIQTAVQIPLNGNNKNLIYQIKITDGFGNNRKLLSYKSGITSATIPVADLKPGIYLVSIFNGNTWISKSLIIQR
jgi:hypothetical protein